MRPVSFFLLGLAISMAVPESGASQGAPESAAAQATETSSASASPHQFVTPEERVAHMVREALRAPDQAETWDCLDLALSEMNGPVREGRGSQPVKGRVSDSPACQAASSASSATRASALAGGQEVAWKIEVLLAGAWQRAHSMLRVWNDLTTREPWLFPGLLLFSALLSMWLGRFLALRMAAAEDRSRKKQREGRASKPEAVEIPGEAANLALALWQGGLPHTEISRRTGLAQDAVSILLNLSEEVPEHFPQRGHSSPPPNPYAQMDLGGR